MRMLGMLGFTPAAETVVAVPQAVEEEGRDVCGGLLRYLNS